MGIAVKGLNDAELAEQAKEAAMQEKEMAKRDTELAEMEAEASSDASAEAPVIGEENNENNEN